MILHNGKIYTLDDSFSVTQAVSIRDGRILAVGSDRVILDTYNAPEKIDLNGNCVYPGLIDAHCHFTGYGKNLLNADLTGTSSFEEIVKLLIRRHQENPGEWVLGRGWDQNDWESKKFPDRELLDRAFPDTPVLLRRIDGHAAMVNREALRRAGIHASTTVEGGSILIRDGRLTGLLVDNAINLVERVVPSPGREEIARAVLQAQEDCFAVGLTSVHDAGLDHLTISLIDSLQRAGELKMRIYAMLSPGRDNYEAYMFKGLYKTDHLNVRSVKLYADGALGSRGALLLEPYSDDTANRGLSVSSREYLLENSRLALQHGYQVNTHCIGDSANRLVLDVYAGLLGDKNDRRWRIEHAQIIHPEDFRKFGDFSVIPSVQSTHATSDMYWADERLGEKRLGDAYAYRRLKEENGWIPNGSDFPVENINPLYGFYALTVRKDLEGYPEGGFQTENALSRKDALRAMTLWAARAAFEEHEKGSLEAGKMADFIITDEDLLGVEADAIPKIRILQTWLGGELVYHADSP
jgi:predicted amidohydrolase YtcJ